jgi:hypothetical protein
MVATSSLAFHCPCRNYSLERSDESS